MSLSFHWKSVVKRCAGGIAVWAAVSANALGGNFPVLNTGDAGADTFRQAVIDVNASVDAADTIGINTNGTLTPATPLPSLNVANGETLGISNAGGVFVLDGALVIEGDGTTTVGSGVSLAGTTTINGGTLELNSGNSNIAIAGDVVIGDGIGVDRLRLLASSQIKDDSTITVNANGILETFGENLGGLNGDGSVVMTNSGMAVGFGNITSQFDGVISGNANLFKEGAGTFTLTDANTYTGLTLIGNGTFLVNGSTTSDTQVNGGTLGGSGTINGTVSANAGSTVAAGNSIGVLNINGQFVQNAGSTLEVELAAGGNTPGTHNDQINVTGAPGTAVINGGTVDVQAAAGSYTPGTIYTIVDTTGGVTGTYDALNHNFGGFLLPTLVYNANNVQLLLGTSFAGGLAGVTPNQMSVAMNLDQLAPTATGNLAVMLGELSGQNNAQALAGLDQLSGAVHATSAQLGIQRTTQIMQLLSRQVDSSGSSSPGAFGSIADAGTMISSYGPPVGCQMATTLPASLGGGPDDVVRGQSCGCYCGWNGWISGFGLDGDLDSDGNANGAEFSVGGTMFAASKPLSCCSQAGVFGGYVNSKANTDANAGSDVDSGFLGGYYRHDLGCLYVTAAAAYFFDSYETNRRINFGTFNQVAQASYDGDQAVLYLENGGQYCYGGFLLQPLWALQYIRMNQDGFTETGAGGANLQVDDLETDSLRLLVGGRVSTSHCVNCWQITPELRALWMHELLDETTALAGSLNGGGTPAFTISGLSAGRDWAILGVGATLSPCDCMNLYVSYDVQVNDRQALHVGSGGLQVIW